MFPGVVVARGASGWNAAEMGSQESSGELRLVPDTEPTGRDTELDVAKEGMDQE